MAPRSTIMQAIPNEIVRKSPLQRGCRRFSIVYTSVLVRGTLRTQSVASFGIDEVATLSISRGIDKVANLSISGGIDKVATFVDSLCEHPQSPSPEIPASHRTWRWPRWQNALNRRILTALRKQICQASLPSPSVRQSLRLERREASEPKLQPRLKLPRAA